jgi:hypothetical protein
MRANPKVCVQADEIQNQGEWISVIVYGEYEELPDPQYTAERKHASWLLARRYHWWLNALGERQMRVGENSIEPLSSASVFSPCRDYTLEMKRRGVDNCLSAIQRQIVEGVRVQKVQRAHHNISSQMFASLAHADAFHSGGARGFDAVLGIFYNDAMLGRDTQFGGGDQENFRVRLTSMYIFSRHNGFKAFARV